MNYAKIYEDLIAKAQSRSINNNVYAEIHHIVPRCMGGSDEKSNLVLLLPEEHLLAHLILIRLYPTVGGLKLAVYQMLHHLFEGRAESLNKKYANWRRYIVSELKKLKWWNNGLVQKRSEECPGPNFRLGMLTPAWNKGLPQSQEQRLKQSIKLKGRPQPEKTAEARSNSGHAGTKWWTDGIKNKRSVDSPGHEWQLGFTAKSTGSKGMSWWNNGTAETLAFDCPGSDWKKGKMKNNRASSSKGTKWWTNGKQNLRAVECTTEGWYRGVTR